MEVCHAFLEERAPRRLLRGGQTKFVNISFPVFEFAFEFSSFLETIALSLLCSSEFLADPVVVGGEERRYLRHDKDGSVKGKDMV